MVQPDILKTILKLVGQRMEKLIGSVFDAISCYCNLRKNMPHIFD